MLVWSKKMKFKLAIKTQSVRPVNCITEAKFQLPTPTGRRYILCRYITLHMTEHRWCGVIAIEGLLRITQKNTISGETFKPILKANTLPLYPIGSRTPQKTQLTRTVMLFSSDSFQC